MEPRPTATETNTAIGRVQFFRIDTPTSSVIELSPADFGWGFRTVQQPSISGIAGSSARSAL